MDFLIQVTTPYYTGTGFYIKKYDLIVTSELLVRGNHEVVIEGTGISMQTSKVLYTDALYDIALLKAPKGVQISDLAINTTVEKGTSIKAFGHEPNQAFSSTKGIVIDAYFQANDINYIEFYIESDACDNCAPVLDDKNQLIGVNTNELHQSGSTAYAFPSKYLLEIIEAFKDGDGQLATRCVNCTSIIFEHHDNHGLCPDCNEKISFPSAEGAYEPTGISNTIEALLKQSGYDISLSRRGPNNWEISKGSATIDIFYYEKAGLIIGDAYLCQLPLDNFHLLYEYLLKQNYSIEGLTLSIKGQDIVLSLIIYDRYLNMDTGMKLFNYLFEKADFYDNVLVEQYGARWNS